MIVEATPKAKTVTWDFFIPSLLGGRRRAGLCKYKSLRVGPYDDV